MNASMDDFEVVNFMNKNFYGYCSSRQQRQAMTVKINQTLSDTISVERTIPEEIINR